VAQPGKTVAPPRRRPSIVAIVAVVVVLIIAILAIVMISRACSGPQAVTYLPAEAAGSWTATVRVLAPQIAAKERWRSDCEADDQCSVLFETCEIRERPDRFSEREVDNYDEFAYEIYFEELEQLLYEASGDAFVATELNPDEDRWEGDRHIVSEEWLDKDTCQYTNYTVWVTDPDDPSQEVEVVLSQCEVWDHVVITEKVYERDEFCQTENVEGLEVTDTLTEQGSGVGVSWPSAITPDSGELERRFHGVVVLRADGKERTVTVSDPDAYARYLTVPQYLGLDEEGNVVRVTSQKP
jgi:hypothetical protein